MDKVDIDSLQGWLIKKKKKDKFSLFSEKKRWFKVKELEGADSRELAFCYFASPKDSEARGWIYCRDVSEIFDDDETFSLVSPSRSMTLVANSRAYHRLWVQGMVDLCPNAMIDGITSSIIRPIISRRSESKDTSPRDDIGKKTEGGTPRINVDRESFDNLRLPPQAQDHNISRVADTKKPKSHDRNINLNRPDKSQTAGGGGGGDDESDDGGDNNDMNDNNESRGRRRGRSGSNGSASGLAHIRSNSNDSNQGGGGVGVGQRNTTMYSSSSSNANAINGSSNREDHRLSGFRPSMSAGVASRINDHIRGEEFDPQAFNGKPNSISSYNYTDNTHHNNDDDDDGDLAAEHIIETVPTPSSNRKPPTVPAPRRTPSTDFSNSTVGASVAAEEKRRGDSGFRSNNSSNNNSSDEKDSHTHTHEPSALAMTKKAPPPPSAAPPRRAKDALAAESLDGGVIVNNNKTRLSVDDIIKNKAKTAATDFIDSDEEEDLDIKAERKRYVISPDPKVETSKPPRPPGGLGPGPVNTGPSGKPLQVTTNTSSSSSSANGNGNSNAHNNRISTPPRQAGDPGITMDDNFVSDNWDDSMELDSPPIRKVNKSSTTTSNAVAKGGSSSGVRADENWLDEDFDDN